MLRICPTVMIATVAATTALAAPAAAARVRVRPTQERWSKGR